MLEPSAHSSEACKPDDLAEWPMLGLWPRGENGFEWVEGQGLAGQYHRVGDQLVPSEETTDPGPWLVPKDRYGKPYSILRRRASLLRDFANLGKDASLERILAFANKWGRLGVEERWVHAADGQARAGASFAAWRQSAVRVAMLTGLWRLVKAGDEGRLREFVDWTEDSVAVRIPHVSGRLRPDLITLYESDIRRMLAALEKPGDAFEQPVLASKFRDPSELLKKWTPGDVLEPMRYYVCREVNKALEGHINRAVLPYWDNNIHYMPDSLLACVYVAFQDVIAGAVATERECLHCGMPFTATRRNKRYCNDNCAKRASDKRVAQRKGR